MVYLVLIYPNSSNLEMNLFIELDTVVPFFLFLGSLCSEANNYLYTLDMVIYFKQLFLRSRGIARNYELS
jgi:hypothetical protein